MPASGAYGNAGRNIVRGPGSWQVDLAVSRQVNIAEGLQLQFRAEAFNVFNHAQFTNPNGLVNNTGQGGFGYVTGARDPRIMQVALKFLF